ncbi:MAG: DNA polymerase domain-containing protein [Spirochaetaceae bacterium]|nr:DNA polymerase domain-containing protein [Spirochaetaceae bacterium]
MLEARGFIVSAWDESSSEGSDRILLTGRLEDGRSFAAISKSPGPAIYVPEAFEEKAAEALRTTVGSRAADDSGEGFAGAGFAAEDWSDMAGARLSRFILPIGSLSRAERALRAAGVTIVAAERRRAQDYLSGLRIKGPVLVRGEDRPGRRVDLVFMEPELLPVELDPAAAGRAAPRLRWLAMDIETDRDGSVVAISLAEPGAKGEVLFLPANGEFDRLRPASGIEAFPDESSLLAAFAGRLVRRDPDVLTGWNVLDFDLRVLAERFAKLGLIFDIGRTAAPAIFLDRQGGRSVFDLPGRAALDAMRLVRGSGSRYEDMSLESVAREVLGEGKSVSAKGEEKLEELDRLRRRDPEAFCAYCLRDSELVLRILDATGLDGLTVRRAALTGVSLDLAWTSIPAFERVYGSELRARRILPPAKEPRRVSGAAGGTVLDPIAGIFPRVLVFDFRSLYPSIMRTFNVDPLAHARALARESSFAANDLTAPNGARFDREPGILPFVIARYAEERERALAAGDEVAAYVYKILQNSFYGVLGAEGCRYALTELAGAITSYGKKFLTSARDFFEAQGLRVLYGDTDSIFALSGLGENAGLGELMALGNGLADELNREISRRIEEEYGLESKLRIRCEKAYARFLIPRLRADPSDSGRGRAKGYAGLLLDDGGGSRVEVKGMEAARSDFTPLARRFQVELLALAFADEGAEALRDYCKTVVADLRAARLDGELTYRKSLRRPAEDYASETPQVHAARMLGWTERRGRISYVMTKAGAEPASMRSGSSPDYDHYVERQIAPIAVSIADALGFDAKPWFADRPQIELDFR